RGAPGAPRRGRRRGPAAVVGARCCDPFAIAIRSQQATRGELVAAYAGPVRAQSWYLRVKQSLSPAEWRRVGGMTGVIVGLHVVGFGILLLLVVPHGAFGLGVGVTAYTLGLRHAFDVDHIGAIDNTTRKLMSDGQRPLSVGFFFSLGHSTIVFVLGALVTIGVRGLSGAVENGGSSLHQATALIGPLVSGSFLFIIGILNLIILISIFRIFRRMREGHFDERELEEQLESRGVMNRFYGRATNAVT